MYYVQSPLVARSTRGSDRQFCEGPFETFAAARTCARINARKLSTTLRVVRADEVQTDEPAPAPTLIDLEAAMDKHDWYYSYSDDHRVWQRGEASYAKLVELAKEIDGGMEMFSTYRERRLCSTFNNTEEN